MCQSTLRRYERKYCGYSPPKTGISDTRHFQKLTLSIRVTASYFGAVVLLFESGKLIAWPLSKGRGHCVTHNILLVCVILGAQTTKSFGGMLFVAVNLIARFLGWGSRQIIDYVNESWVEGRQRAATTINLQGLTSFASSQEQLDIGLWVNRRQYKNRTQRKCNPPKITTEFFIWFLPYFTEKRHFYWKKNCY